MMMPNSSGLGTRLRPMVTSAPFSRWKRTMSVRSMSVSASPEMTRKRLVAELVGGVLDAAGRAERRLLGGVVQAHAELVAVAEVVADQGGQELHGDDGLGEAVPFQQPQHVLHDRPVDHR